jgi:hypothetical protein
MKRREFLPLLHRLVQPRNYLEIGVAAGDSLRFSRVPTIAIDPDYQIAAPVHCDLELARTTSDEFFARGDPIHHVRSGRDPRKNAKRGRPLFDHYLKRNFLDLAFIDGMHHFDFVLRDFMNVERFSAWSTVIAFDDMLPRNVDEAARDRHTGEWAGDVFKLIGVFARYRPDLVVIPVDTLPTGLLLVLGADPSSTVLAQHYETIVGELVVPDPQLVPAWILDRRTAVDAGRLVASDLWADLRSSRRWGRGRAHGMSMIERHLAALGASRSGVPGDADSGVPR